MGIKIKATAAITSMLIVANTVGVQANTSITSQASTICASGFGGCVLPGKTAPAKTEAPAPKAAPVAEEKGGTGGLLIGALAAAAVVAGILIASGDDDDDTPASP